MSETAHHVRLSETRARQGRRGLHIFWVLAISITLAALALVAAWAWRYAELTSVNDAQKAPPAAAKSFTEDVPAPRQTTTPTP